MLGFEEDQYHYPTVNERDAPLPGVSNEKLDSHNDQLPEVIEIIENDLSFGRIEGNLEPNAQMSEVSEGSEHELTFANIGAHLDDPNVQLPEVSEDIEREPTFARIEEFSDDDEAQGPFKIQFR